MSAKGIVPPYSLGRSLAGTAFLSLLLSLCICWEEDSKEIIKKSTGLVIHSTFNLVSLLRRWGSESIQEDMQIPTDFLIWPESY